MRKHPVEEYIYKEAKDKALCEPVILHEENNRKEQRNEELTDREETLKYKLQIWEINEEEYRDRMRVILNIRIEKTKSTVDLLLWLA